MLITVLHYYKLQNSNNIINPELLDQNKLQMAKFRQATLQNCLMKPLLKTK